MSGAARICAAVAVLGLVVLGLLALRDDGALLSWLAAWLLVSALPLGALPLVLGCEAFGIADGPPVRTLRRMLPLMPVAALLAVPLLADRGALYPPASTTLAGFAATWMRAPMLLGRTLLMLIVWTGLALLFRRPPGGRARTGLAMTGLALHLVMLTLFATDWVGGIEPGLGSSSLGVLLLAAQCGAAYAAVLCIAAGSAAGPGRHAAALLAALSGAWLFLHFTQFLVVWSANLPEEVVWYLHRGGGLGAGLAWAGLLVALLALALAITGAGVRLLAIVAGLTLLVHAAEMAWLVEPARRGAVSVTLADLLALLVAAAVAGAALLQTGRTEGRYGAL